jgi:two-component system, NarL family, response regulator DesR
MVAAAPRSPSNCVSEGTVRNYLSEAISKVGGRNRVDAARIAWSKGWL